MRDIHFPYEDMGERHVWMLLASQKGKAAKDKEPELCTAGRESSSVSGSHSDSLVLEEKLKNMFMLDGGRGSCKYACFQYSEQLKLQPVNRCTYLTSEKGCSSLL